MSKDDEIKALKKFVDSIGEDSYLYDILTPVIPAIADMVKSDIIDPSRLPELWNSLVIAKRELDTLRKQHNEEIEAQRARLTDINRQFNYAAQSLQDIGKANDSITIAVMTAKNRIEDAARISACVKTRLKI